MAEKYRDGLFRSYFSDKVRLLSLCNMLTGVECDNPDEIVINTLDGTFFEELKNDISCIYRDRFLVIIEHQSTFNENMPLRILFYAANFSSSMSKPGNLIFIPARKLLYRRLSFLYSITAIGKYLSVRLCGSPIHLYSTATFWRSSLNITTLTAV